MPRRTISWISSRLAGRSRRKCEATDKENMVKIQDIITKDLDRIGRRDALTINWHSVPAP